MFKQQKGITLIALVITIIVLLILAGITIAMLTGGDSAPQKANEAQQKNDIATAKDQVFMSAQDALLTYYDDTYVKAGAATGTGSSQKLSSASTAAGTAVKTEVEKLTGKTFGTAAVTVEDSTSAVTQANVSVPKSKDDDDGKANAKITIETRDYKATGYIYAIGGGITWEKELETK